MLTDNEIKKALEECIELRFDDTEYATVRLDTLTNALDLINRLQAENERLKANLNIELENFATEYDSKIKAEAYKEFCEKLHTEILEARESNFKAKDERIAKSKKYGIPIDVEDSFLMYCDGKIHALDGIDYFAYNLLKELVGDGDEQM